PLASASAAPAPGKRKLERFGAIGVQRAMPTQIARLTQLRPSQPAFRSATATGAPGSQTMTQGQTTSLVTAAAAPLAGSSPPSSNLSQASGSSTGGVPLQQTSAAADPAITVDGGASG